VAIVDVIFTSPVAFATAAACGITPLDTGSFHIASLLHLLLVVYLFTASLVNVVNPNGTIFATKSNIARMLPLTWLIGLYSMSAWDQSDGMIWMNGVGPTSLLAFFWALAAKPLSRRL
jgi:hypothetical protein